MTLFLGLDIEIHIIVLSTTFSFNTDVKIGPAKSVAGYFAGHFFVCCPEGDLLYLLEPVNFEVKHKSCLSGVMVAGDRLLHVSVCGDRLVLVTQMGVMWFFEIKFHRQ